MEFQHGYGREATIVAFVGSELDKQAVLYPVVEQNDRSRRLAERLGGRIIGTRLLRKAAGVEHPEVVYRIPAPILSRGEFILTRIVPDACNAVEERPIEIHRPQRSCGSGGRSPNWSVTRPA
jgi:hypothetical protein